jgi:hypothetical protein
VSRAFRQFDVCLPFERPFTVAECRGAPHSSIVPGPGAGDEPAGSASGCDG